MRGLAERRTIRPAGAVDMAGNRVPTAGQVWKARRLLTEEYAGRQEEESVEERGVELP